MLASIDAKIWHIYTIVIDKKAKKGEQHMRGFIKFKKLMAFVLAACMLLPLISNQYLVVRAEEQDVTTTETTEQSGVDDVTEASVSTEDVTETTTEEVTVTEVVTDDVGGAVEDVLQASDESGTVTTIDQAAVTELSLDNPLDLSKVTKQKISYKDGSDPYGIIDACEEGHWFKVNVPEDTYYSLGWNGDGSKSFDYKLIKYDSSSKAYICLYAGSTIKSTNAMMAGTYYGYVAQDDSVELTLQQAASIKDLKGSAYTVKESDITSGGIISLEKPAGAYVYPSYNDCGYSEGNLIKITVPADTVYSLNVQKGYLYSYDENMNAMISSGSSVAVGGSAQEKTYYVWLVMDECDATPQFTVKPLKKIYDIEADAVEITEERTSVAKDKVQTIYRYEKDSVYDYYGNVIEGSLESGVLYKYNIPAQTSVSFSLEYDDGGYGAVYTYKDLKDKEYLDEIDNYTNTTKCVYVWVRLDWLDYSYTLVKSEKKLDAYNFTTPYDEEVSTLYKAGNLQDVYLYSWDSESYEIMKTFYGSHPEYEDKVHFVNMGLSGASDEYRNVVHEKLSGGNSVIAALDASIAADEISNSDIIAIDNIGGVDGKKFTDYYKSNAYACSLTNATYGGELKLVCPYVCPGMFIYNKTVAKAVLGTDKPEEVQAYIGDWDSFLETAEKAKNAGYAITSGSGSVLSDVKPDMYKTLIEKGYDNGYTAWTQDWYSAMQNNEILGLFGSTWTMWTVEDDNLANYDICAAPSNYLYGGTYYGANQACLSNPLAAQLLYLMTCDTDAMVQYGSSGTGVLVNNKTAVKTLEKNNAPLKYSGDYASLWNRWDTYARAVGNEGESVGRLSAKKDSAIAITANTYTTDTEGVDIVSIPVDAQDDGTVKYAKSTGKLYSVTLPAKNKAAVTYSKKDRIYVYSENGLEEAPVVADKGNVEFSNLANESKTYYIWISGNNDGATVTRKVTILQQEEKSTDTGKKVDTIIDTTEKGASIIVSENKNGSDTVEEAVVKVSVPDAAGSDEAIRKGIDVITQYNSDNKNDTQVDKIEVAYSGDESVTVSEDVINSLKDLKSNVSLEISKKKNDDDKAVYTWKFESQSIKSVKTVNTKIDVFEDVEDYKNNDVVDNLTDKTSNNCVLAFEHEGALPENTEIIVNVEKYANGTKLYYYHIDVKNNKLEEIGNTVVENGYATLKLSHCSDYLISDKAVCQHKNTEVRNQKAASCTTEGYTGDTYCKDCEKVISEGSVISKTDHVAGPWITDKEATVDAEGSKHTECTVCKKVLETKKIDKLPAPKPTVSNVYNGVDYSAVYDYDYYISRYGDIKKAYGSDSKAALQHFVNYGMKEGRQAKSSFNVYSYAYKYADLRHAYGNDLKKYYLHYITYGVKEGRVATGTTSMKRCTTVYNGVDYGAVYDGTYYSSHNTDLRKAYGLDDVAMLRHFVNYGMKEGRQAKSSFNVYSYAYKYGDLRRAYKNDLKAYYLHYIKYGKKEGRVATGTTSMQGCTTVYNGVDYSAVYNGTYYSSHNADLRKAFGLDDTAMLRHFINYGMKEGRQAKESFNVKNYKARYADLRRAYGNSLKSYYLHYMNYGKREGRSGK